MKDSKSVLLIVLVLTLIDRAIAMFLLAHAVTLPVLPLAVVDGSIWAVLHVLALAAEDSFEEGSDIVITVKQDHSAADLLAFGEYNSVVGGTELQVALRVSRLETETPKSTQQCSSK